VTSRILVAGILAVACASAGASAADLSAPDPIDQQTLERALYLCQWKTAHTVPDTAPTPAVCKSAAVSIDDAMLQDKQWWTFWARLNPDEALKANQSFSTDFVTFRARLKLKPERAQDLLPPGIQLLKDDWRLKLVHRLTANP
jgi:hypothetical protein